MESNSAPINPIQNSPSTPSPAPTPMQPQAPNTSKKKIIIAAVAGILILLIVVAAYVLTSVNKAPNSSNNDSSNNSQSNAQNNSGITTTNTNLVYGILTSTSATIKTFDLQNKKEETLASLPPNIKKIMVLSGNRLIFINKTDQRDYGEEIAIFDPASKTTTTVLKAEPGYAIDEYAISQNQKYIASWEVKFAPGSSVLKGGYSRVYSLSLDDSNKTKNLLFDEEAVTNPSIAFHYPKAMTNNGDVFTDTFLPLSGSGWAHGVSVASFNGQSRFDLASMKDGTYGTPPMPSPDGKYLVFAGYDGSRGDGLAEVNGFRQATVTPNTIELLDLQTMQRIKLENLPNDRIYNEVYFDEGGNGLIYTALGKNVEISGIYHYNLQTKSSKKIVGLEDNSRVILTSLSDNLFLVGKADTSASTIANLGYIYAPSLTNVSIFNTADGSSTLLEINELLFQHITLAKITSSQNSVLGIIDTVNAQIQIQQDDSQLKLKQFTPPKPSLAPVRTCQQSSCNPPVRPQPPVITPPSITPPTITPPAQPPTSNWRPPTNSYCSEIYGQQCIAAIPGVTQDILNLCIREAKAGASMNNCQTQMNNAAGDPNAYVNFINCVASTRNQQVCLDTPLYLYGPTGQNVQVTVNTPISNSNIPGDGKYNVTLESNGKFLSHGKVYESITSDYVPAIRNINPPKSGSIVSINELPNLLINYANNLGLNEKETSDLVKVANRVNSPFVFVSFFDQKTSELILPLSFNPKPDTYQNIVFYFKQLQAPLNYTPLPPVFDKIPSRNGFTAIEISEIIE